MKEYYNNEKIKYEEEYLNGNIYRIYRYNSFKIKNGK